jgi:hypothetical protein
MVRMIANPLKLGEMAPQYFVPGEHWKDHFRRKAPDGLDGVKVSELREWIAWGIPPILENLIILACAAQLNCSFSLHGSHYQTSLKDIPGECKLKTQELPAQGEWDKARHIQDALLGLAGLPKLMTAQTLDVFSAKVREEAASYEKPVNHLVSLLASEAGRQGLDEDFDRLNAAREAQRFLAMVKSYQGCALVKALSGFTSESPDEAISTSIKGTGPVLHVLPIDRKTLDLALGLDSPLKEEAQKLKNELLSALRFNEYVAALAPVVDQVNSKALAILQRQIQGTKGFIKPAARTVPPGEKTGDADGVAVVIPAASGATRNVASKTGWSGSDETEVLLKYGDDRDALERNRKRVRDLKALYRGSQVEGDKLPEWVPESLVDVLLEVHHIEPLGEGGEGGEDERSNMIVLTPTLHALMHACDDARIDLKSGLLSIQSLGIERKITVKANHNG